MGLAPGIAGSRTPEVDGIFLCVYWGEDEWFTQLNNTGGPVDIWEVRGVSSDELVESTEGHLYIRRPVAPEHLRLLQQDVLAVDPWGKHA